MVGPKFKHEIALLRHFKRRFNCLRVILEQLDHFSSRLEVCLIGLIAQLCVLGRAA